MSHYFAGMLAGFGVGFPAGVFYLIAVTRRGTLAVWRRQRGTK